MFLPAVLMHRYELSIEEIFSNIFTKMSMELELWKVEVPTWGNDTPQALESILSLLTSALIWFKVLPLLFPLLSSGASIVDRNVALLTESKQTFSAFAPELSQWTDTTAWRMR